MDIANFLIINQTTPLPPKVPLLIKTNVQQIVQQEKPIFSFKPQSGIPALPPDDDPTKIDVRYPLIEPYAYARIYWDKENTELFYKVEEPEMSLPEKNLLETLEDGIREIINLSFISVSDPDVLILYLEKNIKILLAELSIKVTLNSFLKIMYYIYRDFVGLNELEPMMNDYHIEDIECNGVNSPVYVVHRKYRNIRTNLIYTDVHKMASFVEKIAQKCGKYISYAEPLLDGSLPDGSRINASYTKDITSKGPTFCFKEGYLQLYNGDLIDIQKFFNKAKKQFGSKEEKGNEIVFLKDKYCIGVNENTLEQEKSLVKTIIKIKPPKELVKISLDDGNDLEVTLDHLFHIIGENSLITKKAKELRRGDLIPMPITLHCKTEEQKISLKQFLEDTLNEKIYVIPNTQIKKLVSKILSKYSIDGKINRKFLSKKYNVDNFYHYEILTKNRAISSKNLLELCKEDDFNLDHLDNLSFSIYGGGTKTNPKSIKLPNKLTEDLAYISGLIVGDGHLSKHAIDISCYNSLKKQIKPLLANLFGKSNSYYSGNRTYVCNKILPLYFNKIFDIPIGNKSKIVEIPKIIFRSNNKIIASFLAGLFDADGTVHASVSYKTASKELAKQLTYALARLSVFSIIRKEEGLYRVVIPSPYELQFFNLVKIKDKQKKKDLTKRIASRQESYKSYRNSGRYPSQPVISLIKKTNFLFYQISKEIKVSWSSLDQSTYSKNLYKKILNFFIIKRNSLSPEAKIQLDYLITLLNFNQEFIAVKEVEIKKNKSPVYDIELTPNKFYIAGNKPINMFDTVRKFVKTPWSPLQLMQKRTLSAEILAYLWMVIEYENSVMIVGGTGSGKTSFLNCAAFFIPAQARIVSIEDTRELSLEHENWLPSVARAGVGLANITGQKYGEVSLFDLLKASFRQRPDYIIVGEIRGKEAYVLFQAMASGHPSMATMHAENVETMIRRLQTPPISLSGSLIMSVSTVVVMSQTRVKGKEVRRVSHVDEIIEVKEKLQGQTINPVFSWDPVTDTFRFNPRSYVFHNIGIHFGLTPEQLLVDLKRRSILINVLYQKGIIGFQEVQKIIHEYYKSPKAVLDRFGVK